MNDLLAIAISAAVPLNIMRIEAERWTWERVLQEAHSAADVVASKGDVIQFRSKTKGETAAAFNSLALGMACASFAPGGIKFMGTHFVGDASKLLENEGSTPEPERKRLTLEALTATRKRLTL